MSFEVAFPLAYVASMAGFFAFVGRRNGFWWVVIPLLLGSGFSALLLMVRMTNSTLFTPLAIITVFSPIAVAFANRLTGYRWWPAFSVSRPLLVAWLALGALLLIGSLGLLIGLVFFSG